MTDYRMTVTDQGVRQLAALTKFCGTKYADMGLLTINAKGVAATDSIVLGVALAGHGIRWDDAAPENVGINAKTLLSMIPKTGGRIIIEGDRFTVTNTGYEANGLITSKGINWERLIPDEPDEAMPMPPFNPKLMSKFAALADAMYGKPNTAVWVEPTAPRDIPKPVIVHSHHGLLGLIMPMKL